MSFECRFGMVLEDDSLAVDHPCASNSHSNSAICHRPSTREGSLGRNIRSIRSRANPCRGDKCSSARHRRLGASRRPHQDPRR